MAGSGLKHPERRLLICAGVIGLCALSIWSGVAEMNALGHETTASAIKIALGGFIAVLAVIFGYSSLLLLKVARRTKRGEGVIARWTVTPAEWAEYRINDAARSAHGPEYRNDYNPPETVPEAGVEIIFREDGVWIDGDYFPLTTTGILRFSGVKILTETLPAIEFGTRTTYAAGSGSYTNTLYGLLRLPGSRAALDQLERTYQHYAAVDRREVIVNPGFYRGRKIAGLVILPAGLAVAAVGYWLVPRDPNPDPAEVTVILGVGLATFGALLALLGWMLGRVQRRR